MLRFFGNNDGKFTKLWMVVVDRVVKQNVSIEHRIFQKNMHNQNS